MSDTHMDQREALMEENEILDNVDEYEHHHLERDNPEAVKIKVTHDEKIKRVEEKLSALDWWVQAERDISQYFEQTEPDSGIEPANASCSWEADMPHEQGIQLTEPASNGDHHWERGKQNDEEILPDFWGDAESEFRQFKERTEPGCSVQPTHESSFADAPLPPEQGIQQSELATVAPQIKENNGDDGDFFLKLQEASNICKAAYKEIMSKALDAKTYIESSPVLGSLEEFEEMFSSPPPCGMSVECSIETAIVPLPPHILASIMMDADRWALSLPGLVYRGSGHDPTGVFKQLTANDGNIIEVKMVNAEVRLPTQLVETRKFCFLRFQRQIIKNIWAIVDISNDYFLDNPDGSISERMCRRRPSGVIIRGHGNNSDSEVIWIENVEVYECQLENNIYSTVVNTNIAFCAKHWVSSFSHKIHRLQSKYYRCNMQVNQEARAYLLELCDHMMMIFSQCVHEYPDEKKMTILSDEEGIRILKDATQDFITTLDLDSYVGLTSFRVNAKPISVFAHLTKKNIELEWPSLRNQEEPEQIITLASKDTYNCITLYRRLVSEYGSPKVFECILQEISRDDFCSYVISAPITQRDAYNSLCCGERRNIPILTSGFAIMPDGSGGLQSDASLVTIVVHKQLDVAEADRAIDIMTDVVTTTMGDIEEAVAEGDRDNNGAS